MALPKHFLSNRFNDLNISRANIIIGFILGLIAAFSFYALCIVSRDVFRFLSIIAEFKGWILTENEKLFHNFIFGYLSAILGQTIAINYLLHRSRRVFQKKRIRYLDITTHQNFNTWNTLNWFVRLATIYGLFFYMNYFVFSLYPNYNYFFILLIIVVFLSSWNTTILIFKRQTYRILLISALINSLIALGLSQINFLENNTIIETIKKTNIHYYYTYEKVESNFYFSLEKRDLVESLYVVFPKDNLRNDPVIVNKNKEITLEQLPDFIENSRIARDEADRKFLTYELCVHKEIPLKFVSQIKLELAKMGCYKIAYVVAPKGPEYNSQGYSESGIPVKLPPVGPVKRKRIAPPPPKPPNYSIFFNEDMKDKVVFINHIEKEEFKVNDQKLNLEELKEFYKNDLASLNKNLYVFLSNNELVYENYLNALIVFREAAREVKDEIAFKRYGMNYESLDDLKAWEINKTLPLPFADLNIVLLSYLVEQGIVDQEIMDRFYIPK